MKTKGIILAVLFSAVNIVFGANVTDKSGTTAFSFLKIGQGARASAMADTYVGLSDDINAIYWNPAGIAQLSSRELIANHTLWFESISRSYVSYIHPKFSFGSLGVSLNAVYTNIEKRTAETDDASDSALVGDIALSAAWGRQFSDKILLGAALKYISEFLDMENVQGISLDIGGLYRIQEGFQAGLSVQNFGIQMVEKGDSDPMPLLLRAGVSRKLLEDRLVLLSDINLGLVDQTSSLSIGGEYKVSEMFYPRLGYKFRMSNNNLDAIAGFSAGFGLKYKSYRFDYAFVPYGELGFTHCLDFGIKF